MRINVIGDCHSAKALRGYLSESGYALSDFMPRYTFQIEENPLAVLHAKEILFDSIDCDLEDRVFRRVRELTAIHIRVQTAGGNQSDKTLRIVVPPDNEARRAVELGSFRGIEELSGRGLQDAQNWEENVDSVIREHRADLDRLEREVRSRRKTPWYRRLL